ncbi:hypothetical protein CSB37_03285 [bacterium DOLZORAL124_38_8]|nr:MAG: hypothetical protein CSB37_03285 [bacterium DOLZORAL124_38_8]
MKKSDQQKLIHKFMQHSRAQKLPITPQKIEIFTYLISTKSHPTAKKIWQEVKEIFPHISLATIYQNLKNFEKLGFLRTTEIPDGTKRFEINPLPHHHIINLDTNRILDTPILNIEETQLPETLQKFELETIEINYFVRNKT